MSLIIIGLVGQSCATDRQTLGTGSHTCTRHSIITTNSVDKAQRDDVFDIPGYSSPRLRRIQQQMNRMRKRMSKMRRIISRITHQYGQMYASSVSHHIRYISCYSLQSALLANQGRVRGDGTGRTPKARELRYRRRRGRGGVWRGEVGSGEGAVSMIFFDFFISKWRVVVARLLVTV